MSDKRKKWCEHAPLLTALFLVLGVQLFLFVNKYAVNLPYLDQWGFYSVFVNNGSWLDVFRYQHGPHRQGVAFLLTKWLYDATNWNIRAEGFFIAGVLLATAITMLTALRRMRGQLTLWDATIPLLIVTPTFFENMVLTPNASHSIFSLFLLSVLMLVQTMPSAIVRTSLSIATYFLLIFTGFGLLIGCAILAWQCFELACSAVNKSRKAFAYSLAELLGMLLSLALFFIGYVHAPAIDCFTFPHPSLDEYVLFIFYLIGFFGGVHVSYVGGLAKVPSLIFGACQFVLILAVYSCASFDAFRTRRHTPLLVKTVWILMTSSLMYLVATAVGRVCAGVATGQAFRYFPLIAPAYLGMFIYLGEKTSRTAKTVMLALLVMVCAKALLFSLPTSSVSFNFLAKEQAKKRVWMDTYRATHDIAQANSISGITISGGHDESLLKGLDFFKKNHFGFLSDK